MKKQQHDYWTHSKTNTHTSLGLHEEEIVTKLQVDLPKEDQCQTKITSQSIIVNEPPIIIRAEVKERPTKLITSSRNGPDEPEYKFETFGSPTSGLYSSYLKTPASCDDFPIVSAKQKQNFDDYDSRSRTTLVNPYPSHVELHKETFFNSKLEKHHNSLAPTSDYILLDRQEKPTN